VFIENAPTFLDESRDPNRQRLDLDRLRGFDRPALLTKGTASPPFLIAVVEAIGSALPHLEIETIEGADHAPHQTTPKQYVDVVRRFVGAARVS
jgi:pimeloyl-ACP methyl ester carboxylesterase